MAQAHEVGFARIHVRRRGGEHRADGGRRLDLAIIVLEQDDRSAAIAEASALKPPRMPRLAADP